MHDGEWRSAQAIERLRVIQVADDRNDAARAKLGNFVAAPDQTVQSRASSEQRGRAERDITAADQQNPDHEQSSFTRSDQACRADA